MDLLSLLGIVIAFAAIITGNILDGGNIAPLINPAAALIVVGGTVGATLLQTSLTSLVQAVKMLSWIFFPPKSAPLPLVKKILTLSKTARREGLLGLEDLARKEPDRVLKKGLMLLADGFEPDRIRLQLEEDIQQVRNRAGNAANIYGHMGGYAPTIGIIGAVMGLIHVMGNLDEPEKIGAGVATAFVATIYGVGFANLLLYPIAGKLKSLLQLQNRQQVMALEGLVAIAEGEHPSVIEMRLRSMAGLGS
ncbi:MAG: chemotaxis protein MotA [Candidatus Azotimanducaceae bacterium]|jgi:chemotaxis protein MotA